MKLLMLGGTIFVGRQMVEDALTRGHEVTLFNRGQHHADLFPEVEKLRGDRDGKLDALVGRQWDAVIDTCGYLPRIVRQSAELLADSVNHYTFISSVSVYADGSQIGLDESAPVGTLADESVEIIDGETYGPLKALCEQAAETAMPGRVLNVRPGYIVGPYDPSDRFTWWPYRVSGGGEMAAAGGPDRPLQVIDVRDLSQWVLDLIEADQTGLYNATGPDYDLTFGHLLQESCRVTGRETTWHWLSDAFLAEQGIEAGMTLPLWAPEEYVGWMTVNVQKAMADGLAFRPLADTIAATLAWAATRPADYEWRTGLTPEREAALLAAWRRQIENRV